MASQFFIYFKLGFQHILNVGALDHILFIIGICVVYSLKDWLKVAYLVSAFTFGHLISLIITLSSEEPFISSHVIEVFIPLTILLVAYANIFIQESKSDFLMKSKYWFSGLFGIIHGLGFSNYLRSILMSDDLAFSLFAFNFGVELGQLIIVAIVLFCGYLAVDKYGMDKVIWRRNTSIFIFIFATNLLIEAWRHG